MIELFENTYEQIICGNFVLAILITSNELKKCNETFLNVSKSHLAESIKFKFE